MPLSSPFQRAVDVLERAHRLALILLVGPGDRANEAREQLARLLPPHLHVRSYRIDRQGPDILSFAASLADPFPILFVHGFERLHPEHREDVEVRLNLLRDAFAQHHLGLVFWLSRDTLESFLQHCPDLFAWRSLLDEVDGSELAIPPILSTRREYLSRVLAQTRARDALVEVRVRAADPSALPISFQEWAVKVQLGIVIGFAGSGKTTALQVLAHRLADHALDDATQPVPVLLQPRTFSPAPRFSASDIWIHLLGLGLPAGVLLTLAEAGQLMILLDGLDEAPHAAQHPLLLWIDDLSNQYPRLRMIIATRPVSSSSLEGLSRSWEVVHMQSLTQDRIDELIRRDLAAEGVELPEAELRRIGALLESTPELGGNPLLIRASLGYYLKAGRMPFEDQRRPALDRVRLLSDLVDRQLADFDEVKRRYRGIGRAQRADLLSDKDVRRALQLMALAAMTAGTSSIPRDQLLSLFRSVPDLFSSEAVRESAEYLISRIGLVQAKAGTFAFVHVTVQYYLAAEGLIALAAEKALEVLSAHLSDKRWSEVVLHVVALRELRHAAGVQLVDGLAAHALAMSDANQRAVSFATLLAAALGAGVWSDTLASLLQAARLMIEDASDATYALEPLVDQAMRLHGKVG